MSSLVIPRSHNVCDIMNPPKLQPTLIRSVLATFRSVKQFTEEVVTCTEQTQGCMSATFLLQHGSSQAASPECCCAAVPVAGGRGHLELQQCSGRHGSPVSRNPALSSSSCCQCNLCDYSSAVSSQEIYVVSPLRLSLCTQWCDHIIAGHIKQYIPSCCPVFVLPPAHTA